MEIYFEVVKIVRYENGKEEKAGFGKYKFRQEAFAMQKKLIDQHQRFIAENTIQPHTVIVEVNKIDIVTTNISSASMLFQQEKRPVRICKNCRGHINYGDELVLYKDEAFCSKDCLLDFIDASYITASDEDYDSIY